MYLFALDIDFLCILIERKNSEHHCKIKYSGKDTPIFLYFGTLVLEVFYDICLLPWKTMTFLFILDHLTEGYLQWLGKLKSSVELLYIPGSAPVLNLLLAPEHLNSWESDPIQKQPPEVFCKKR